jgi:hypothetical protein
MTSSIVSPEVLDLDTSILEESPMTEGEEKELVIVKTAIQTAYADKLERDLAIGAGLLQIFRRRLYRGKEGGRTWDTWLKEESAELTAGRGPIERNTSERLRGFYQFRVEILPPRGGRDIALPSAPSHVRPLLGQLSTHPDAAVEMWKAACTEAGKGNVPTFDQVNRAALAYKANESNEARRLSAAQQAALNKANAANPHHQPEPEPVRDYSPAPSPQPSAPTTPSIPAWEIQKDDNSIDAGAECKRITQAINEAHKSIGLLRGILYSQINTYGRDYLGFLRQVDAGVYSLKNIDNQVEQMGEDIDFISALLVADVGEGELAQSTIDVNSMPSRA